MASGLRAAVWLALAGQVMVTGSAMRPQCALQANRDDQTMSVAHTHADATTTSPAIASCGVVLAEPCAAPAAPQLPARATHDGQTEVQPPLDIFLHPLLRPPRA